MSKCNVCKINDNIAVKHPLIGDYCRACAGVHLNRDTAQLLKDSSDFIKEHGAWSMLMDNLGALIRGINPILLRSIEYIRGIDCLKLTYLTKFRGKDYTYIFVVNKNRHGVLEMYKRYVNNKGELKETVELLMN